LISRSFAAGRKEDDPELEVLHAKIGQQALEIDFSSAALNRAGLLRKEMIDGMHDLPVARQYQILSRRARPLIIGDRNSAKPTWY